MAVDGCCLTVTAIDGEVLAFDAVPETLRANDAGRAAARATASTWSRRCVPATRWAATGCRATSTGSAGCASAEPDGDAVNMTFQAPEAVLRYVIEKGSITVNGVSLTVTGFDDDGFSVSVIPHTRAVTNLGALAPGDRRQPGGRPVRQVRGAAGGRPAAANR